MQNSLEKLLKPTRLIEIVDVGSNPIDGEPPYKILLNKQLCKVTGFEPQLDALDKLNASKSALENYLPNAVGDGQEHVLNICKAPGMTSLLEPDGKTLALFDVLNQLSEVTNRVPLKTERLDEIDQVKRVDFLKIDVQGSELAVFQGGSGKLSKAVAIQTEISFITLYKGQPTFGEIDMELRRQGFMPHCFAALKLWPISPCVINNNPYQPLNQLLEADLVYIRDVTQPESMSSEQIKHLALIAHYCYKSYDLALRCIKLLEDREALREHSQKRYMELLSGG